MNNEVKSQVVNKEVKKDRHTVQGNNWRVKMKRIYKYTEKDLELRKGSPSGFLSLPRGSQLLSVMNQKEEFAIYALVDDTEEERESFEFRLIGTGHPFEDMVGYVFLGTVSFSIGSLVFHVFWRRS